MCVCECVCWCIGYVLACSVCSCTTHWCACRGQKRTSGVLLLQYSFPYSFETVSLFTKRGARLVLASLHYLPVSAPTMLELQVCTAMPDFLCWCCGFELGSSCLNNKLCYPLSHFPSLLELVLICPFMCWLDCHPRFIMRVPVDVKDSLPDSSIY